MVNYERTVALLENIRKTLDELKNLKVIAGDGISVSEEGGNVLIARDTSSEYDATVLRWLAALEEKTEEKKFSAGRGLVMEEGPHSIRFSIEDEKKSTEETRSSEETEDLPDFPFRVKGKLDDNDLPYVVVCGHNEAEGRHFRSYVFAGTSAPVEMAEETIYLQSSSWIYYSLDVVLNDSTWKMTHAIRYGASLPSDKKYVVPIAYVVKDGKKYTVHQAHWGSIFIADRVI